MKDSINLSPKHGLNPSVLVCPCCGEDGGVALNGRLKGDAEAPRKMFDRAPCEKCVLKFESYKKDAFLVFVLSDEYEEAIKTEPNANKWFYFKEFHGLRKEAAEKFFINADLSKGAAFMCESFARSLGFKKPEESLAK